MNISVNVFSLSLCKFQLHWYYGPYERERVCQANFVIVRLSSPPDRYHKNILVSLSTKYLEQVNKNE